jgi:SOS-response transcriptional repressor LexA
VETYIPVDKFKQGGDNAAGPGCEDKEPYALMVLGDSMEPEFQEGDVVVIEPGSDYHDGSYVIAYHNDEYIFRQLKVVKDRMYLMPLNPNYVTEQIDGPEAIKGVITQKKGPGGGRRNRKNYD